MPRAQMAEVVDAPVSGTGEGYLLEVRVFFWAPLDFGLSPPIQCSGGVHRPDGGGWVCCKAQHRVSRNTKGRSPRGLFNRPIAGGASCLGVDTVSSPSP